ncbi:MAG: zinc ribbon domain-containing protein [Clostridia bacterium]|nr:zinc ribbon domain-containing protein [Clostridia bacterium]
MKKRRGDIRCVYAGPEFFADKNGEKDENGEAPKKPYPDSFAADEENPVPEMEGVYADPRMSEKNNMRRTEPLMQAVYACPPMRPVNDEPQMMCVYAGPEMMSGSLRPKNQRGQFVKPSDETVMNEVYAGPDMMERELEFREQLSACPKCGNNCNAAANFCPNCGEKLVKPRYCPDCGMLIDESANFCQNCGAPIPHAEAAPPRKTVIRNGFIARPKGSRDELV